MAPIQVVGHRGAAAEAPENTLSALERAWQSGAHWCEVDVQRTADGVAVLVHDDSWQRTAGVDVTVRETPWSTVAGFDVGGWFAPNAAPEAVPSLQAALAWSDRLSLNLEIKSPQFDAGLANAVASAVRGASVQHRCLLSCFDHTVIDALADQYDDLQLGYVGHEPAHRRHPGVAWQILEVGALLDHPEWCAQLHQQNCRVWAWTVDSLKQARQLAECGVEGLITNDPRLLVQHFA